MKNILKTTALAFLLTLGTACENDDQKIITASGGPELLTPLDGAEYILNPATPNAEATTLVWNHADYSEQTEINYEIEVALTGTNFEEIVIAGTTTNRFVTWSVEALNSVALDAGLIPYNAGDLDLRIKSSLGSNSELVGYSNIIKIKVTPYTLDLPTIAVPGNHQGWNPPTAPLLASSGFGETDFEGYVWLDGEFKFVEKNAAGAFEWGNIDYGDDGSFSGVLVEQNESNCSVSSAGYYRVEANTTSLTYNLTATQWGIAGDATTNGWDGMIPMTYNPTTKKWSIIATLTTQSAPDHGLKFKANGDWAINLGDNGADGSAEYGGTNIGTTAGTYLIELDLSNPRAYTYTLTAQ